MHVQHRMRIKYAKNHTLVVVFHMASKRFIFVSYIYNASRSKEGDLSNFTLLLPLCGESICPFVLYYSTVYGDLDPYWS